MNPLSFPTLSRSHLLATMVSRFIMAVNKERAGIKDFERRWKMKRWTGISKLKWRWN